MNLQINAKLAKLIIIHSTAVSFLWIWIICITISFLKVLSLSLTSIINRSFLCTIT